MHLDAPHWSLEAVLPLLTANPAAALKLRRKGRLQPGADADILLLDAGVRARAILLSLAWGRGPCLKFRVSSGVLPRDATVLRSEGAVPRAWLQPPWPPHPRPAGPAALPCSLHHA